MMAPTRPPRSKRVLVADPEAQREDHPPERRAGEPQQDGDEEAARIVAGHERLSNESGHEAEDQGTDHSSFLFVHVFKGVR